MTGRIGLDSIETPKSNSINPKLSLPHDVTFCSSNVFFASVKHMGGLKFNISPNPSDSEKLEQPLILKSTNIGLCIKPESLVSTPLKKKNREGLRLKFKVSNSALRRLISGAFAGAVSRTAVAPLETIRTHLMVGTGSLSSAQVFNNIMKIDGWRGLFRGNFVNVIRVAPSKAIEVCYILTQGISQIIVINSYQFCDMPHHPSSYLRMTQLKRS